MKSLIVGGGQLGKALKRALGADATFAANVPWDRPADAQSWLRHRATEFVAQTAGEPWLVCWSAGRGVIGSPADALRAEREALAALAEGIARAPDFARSQGRVFVASSAGGIYASGDGDPKTEDSEPLPTSDYGRSKLAQDVAMSEWANRSGVPTLIGRISNLYGPNQDIRKAQGFISHLCRAMANRTLFTLSVPVGTIRDFVFADDVAERIAHWAHAESGEPNGVQMKLFASGRSVTLGHVIAMTRAISRTPVRVLMASDAGQINQPAALRFCTTRLLPLEHACPGRSLEEGIQTTWRSTLRGLQLGRV